MIQPAKPGLLFAAMKPETVSLCLITGNCADTLRACLESYRGHVDEIVVVRACGNLEPDASLDIAHEFGAITGEYRNVRERRVDDEIGFNIYATTDWPHTDDFAAARTLAFSLATGDWRMWTDADDQLSPEGAQQLDGLRARGLPDVDVIWSPYVTAADGGYERRERLVRREVFRQWVNPVHEVIEHDPAARQGWDENLRILHRPPAGKSGSQERNLRILSFTPPHERTCRQWWLLSREYECLGQIREMIEALVMATDDQLAELKGGGLLPPEKAAAYRTLGRHLSDVESAERPLLEAVRLQPDHREPLADLCQLHLRRGRPQNALAYARMLDALPEPPGPAFLRDSAIYGWRGADLLALATAKTGDLLEAANLRYSAAGSIRISVAHPTCRPRQAADMRDLWLSRAAQPHRIEYLFGLNAADTDCVEQLGHYPHALSPAVEPGLSSAVANYNAAAAATTGKLIICAQDDVYPPQRWDDLIWEAMKPHLGDRKVLHVHDGFSAGQLMVIMCFTRKWLAHHGELLCPEYDGYYSDTEYSVRAYQRREVIDGRHIRFFHHHPAFTSAPSDEAYMRQQNPEATARGRAIFDRRNPGVLP